MMLLCVLKSMKLSRFTTSTLKTKVVRGRVKVAILPKKARRTRRQKRRLNC
jgi:hypothetical protein